MFVSFKTIHLGLYSTTSFITCSNEYLEKMPELYRKDCMEEKEFFCFVFLSVLSQDFDIFVLSDNSKAFDVKMKDKTGRDLVSAVMWDYEWVSSVSSRAM